MADEVNYHHHHETKVDEPCGGEVETSDRGLFGFGGKKEEEKKCEEEVIVTEFEKVQVCEEKTEDHKEEEEKKHEGLLEKLHRSDSSSSSVSFRPFHKIFTFFNEFYVCFLV